MATKRIPGLDGLRAISISLVLLEHVSGERIRPGNLGVRVFFVLSGFLITWLLVQEENAHGSISLPAFYLRRCLRILPPAFVNIAVVFLLGLLGLAAVRPWEPLYCVLFIRNLMTNGGQHLGQYWSLALEEQFYLLWPLTFLLLRSNRRRLIAGAILLFAAPFWARTIFKLQAIAQQAQATGGTPGFWKLFTGVHSLRFDLQYTPLIAGCCLALVRSQPNLRRIARNTVLRSNAIAAVSAIGIAAIYLGQAAPLALGTSRLAFAASQFSDLFSCIFIVILINFAVEQEDGVFGAFLNWTPIVWIGVLSYSIYLWQQIFCFYSLLPWIGSFPQNLVATFLVAAASFYWIEKPFAGIRKRVPHISNRAWLPKKLFLKNSNPSGAELHPVASASDR